MKSRKMFLVAFTVALGAFALLLPSSEVSADERFRLACRGPTNFSAEATFQWLDALGDLIPFTRVDLPPCSNNNRTPTIRIKAPPVATGFWVFIFLKQGDAVAGDAFERPFSRKLNREVIEFELRRGSKAIFTLNR